MAEEEQVPKGSKKKSAPVVNYITLLFVAAFSLLLMTYLMEQRESAEILDGLRNSVSAMQTVEDLYEENADLMEEIIRLREELLKEQQAHVLLQRDMDDLEKEHYVYELGIHAMDLFWQVNEAFVKNNHGLAEELMDLMEENKLQSFLPTENLSETERFSPAHRYAEIKQEVMGE